MTYAGASEWSPQGVDELEPNADWVVRSTTNCSVIAGPGAGKTELLAQRACYLLQTEKCPPPFRILAISFKRDAAKNLADRVKLRCLNEEAQRFDSLTFDAFAKNLIDRFIDALPSLWRPTRNYDIFYPEYRDYRNFLDDLADAQKDPVERTQLYNIYRPSFAREYVLEHPLAEELNPSTTEEWAAAQWWENCLHIGETSRLSFPMIGRLAELLLRTNPLIRNAIRVTYSHVFMDEFQDTTNVQYSLIKTAFCGSKSVLTAVGDNKQHIMRWAIALDDAFEEFERDFQAKQKYLVSNYRSSPKLVELQHAVALIIDPQSKLAASKRLTEISSDACVIWDFQTRRSEAKHIARFVSAEIQKQRLTPRNFVLLTKQKPESYAETLMPVFEQHGIKLRIESALQDLLVERLTVTLIKFIRFGIQEKAGSYWNECYSILAKLRGIDAENELEERQLQQELGYFHSELHQNTKHVTGSFSGVYSFLNGLIDFLEEKRIKGLYPEYRQGNRFEQVLEQTARLLAQSFENVGEEQAWSAVLDDFEGRDSVPIMTIHKSKGLEHHVVIFIGLDDRAWWSFQKQPEESRCTFFVALSRAKERVIFTYCAQRGERNSIASLYDVLKEAGVKTIACDSH